MTTVPDVFHLLADPTRRELLDALRTGERSVTQLVDVLRISQPGVSKQLRLLKDGGLVQVRRAGRQRMYSIRGVPLRSASDWLQHYERFWEVGLRQMDSLFEAEAKERRRSRQ